MLVPRPDCLLNSPAGVFSPPSRPFCFRDRPLFRRPCSSSKTLDERPPPDISKPFPARSWYFAFAASGSSPDGSPFRLPEGPLSKEDVSFALSPLPGPLGQPPLYLTCPRLPLCKPRTHFFDPSWRTSSIIWSFFSPTSRLSFVTT